MRSWYRNTKVLECKQQLRCFWNTRHHCLACRRSTLEIFYADGKDSTWRHVESLPSGQHRTAFWGRTAKNLCRPGDIEHALSKKIKHNPFQHQNSDIQFNFSFSYRDAKPERFPSETWFSSWKRFTRWTASEQGAIFERDAIRELNAKCAVFQP